MAALAAALRGITLRSSVLPYRELRKAGMQAGDPQTLWRKYFPECAHVHPPEGCRQVRIEGRVDIGSVQRLLGELDAALKGHPSLLDISLAAVSFIDTAGIAVLVETARRARQAQVCLRLADPSPAVLGILEMVHLDHFFPKGGDISPESGSMPSH